MRQVPGVRWWGVAALMAGASSGAVVHANSAKSASVFPVAAGYVELNQAYLVAPDLLRAFIPTRSSSRICLATLSESNMVERGLVVFCAPRRQGNTNGILVTILLPIAAPEDVYISLTVYQQLARKYGRAEPYDGD